MYHPAPPLHNTRKPQQTGNTRQVLASKAPPNKTKSTITGPKRRPRKWHALAKPRNKQPRVRKAPHISRLHSTDRQWAHGLRNYLHHSVNHTRDTRCSPGKAHGARHQHLKPRPVPKHEVPSTRRAYMCTYA